MVEAELSGTSIEKGKGEDEFLEVEELIKATLAESKKMIKEEAPPPPPPVKTEAPPKEEPEPKAAAPVTAAPIAQEPPQPKSEAATYESTFKEYQAGDIVKGTVIKIEPGAVLVDIKYKADGLILPEELSDRSFSSPEEIVKLGEVINVFIDNLENKEGYVVLSKKRAEYESRWREAQDALKNKTLLEGKVVQVVRGGLVVDCGGIRGFVPASQVIKKEPDSLESFKDQVIPVKVIEVNRRQGKIILSHKMAAGEKDKVVSSKMFDELEVGQVRRGKVSSLKNFGAFVDLGGVEGLIHLSELSWKRVKHPSVLLKTGQELDVFVLGIDRVNKKVALGLKELQPDPWENAVKYYKAGQLVKARIARFAKFGAFAELDHDLEGLIHISEMSRGQIATPEDAGVKIGDEVEVKVLRVQPAEQRIGLSIKEAQKKRERDQAREEEKAEPKAALPPEEQAPKVTIGDMIAQKEKERAEREAEESGEMEEEVEEIETLEETTAPVEPPPSEEEPT